ncbi:hypothetical protein GBB54_09945, partial [Bifidobacterium longum]
MSFNSKRCHSDYRRVEQSPKASTKPSVFPCDTASASTETASMPGYRPKCVSVLACVPLWQWAFLLFEL